jgi:hypothetical protein
LVLEKKGNWDIAEEDEEDEEEGEEKCSPSMTTKPSRKRQKRRVGLSSLHESIGKGETVAHWWSTAVKTGLDSRFLASVRRREEEEGSSSSNRRGSSSMGGGGSPIHRSSTSLIDPLSAVFSSLRPASWTEEVREELEEAEACGTSWKEERSFLAQMYFWRYFRVRNSCTAYGLPWALEGAGTLKKEEVARVWSLTESREDEDEVEEEDEEEEWFPTEDVCLCGVSFSFSPSRSESRALFEAGSSPSW